MSINEFNLFILANDIKSKTKDLLSIELAYNIASTESKSGIRRINKNHEELSQYIKSANSSTFNRSEYEEKRRLEKQRKIELANRIARLKQNTGI